MSNAKHAQNGSRKQPDEIMSISDILQFAGLPLPDLYVKCDRVTEFKIKNSLQRKHYRTIRGPFVKARFSLAGEFEHESQVLPAEIRDQTDEPHFKIFLKLHPQKPVLERLSNQDPWLKN